MEGVGQAREGCRKGLVTIVTLAWLQATLLLSDFVEGNLYVD